MGEARARNRKRNEREQSKPISGGGRDNLAANEENWRSGESKKWERRMAFKFTVGDRQE